MNTRGSVVVLPLVPHPHYFKKNSPFCSSCVIFVIFSRIYSYRGSVCFFAADQYPVHKIVEVQGKYTCAFFVSATDDAKKCTAITAHVHRKCAVISVYFFASGKARLPKPPPSTGGLPSAYAFQTYAGILVIVCSAGLAGA